MLLLSCPICGERDESEFDYGGRAIDYPALQAGMDDWHRAVHLPEPTDGQITELWYHAAGCECWVRLQRNPKTHESGSND